MGLLSGLKESFKKKDLAEARRIALQIEASNYPESLKREAVDVLRKLGRGIQTLHNTYSERLYQEVNAQIEIDLTDTATNWLPWRVIEDTGDYAGKIDPGTALTSYLNEFQANGLNTLHYFKKIRLETVEESISDYFDHEFYAESHPDMSGADRDSALRHYAAFGGLENNRKPNRLFNNDDLFGAYPWTKQLGVNALYLLVRWHEQFPTITETINRRHISIKNEARMPWIRPAALTKISNERPANLDYLRALAITQESSSRERLIEPKKNSLNIHIVIPDFTEGGGGHMTIFRMIWHLEHAGHACTVWVKDYNSHRHPEGPRVSAITHYQPINAQVLPLSAHFGFASGDALIATSWDTVEIVCANKSFHDHFYLVQDYEPYFFPRGSEALEAEHTYTKELKTICASSWLDEIMRNKFKRTSTYFNLSYNPSIYNCKYKPCALGAAHECKQSSDEGSKESKDFIRIAFYARSRTDRRAVSLALKGLERLKQDKYTVCIELFGERTGHVRLPANVVGHDNGILSPKQLAELYHCCDIGLTFSATNYALVPQEMMACGLPVIEIDNASTKAIYPEGVLILAEPSASGIAKAIEELANDKAKREEISRNGLNWVQQTSWDSSFEKVERFISQQVRTSASRACSASSMKERYLAQSYQTLKESKGDIYGVTIVIPTCQGGHLLGEAVRSVLSQNIDEPFEIIVIDSSSTDGSIDRLPQASNLSIIKIDKKDFQHGKTRNLGVALSKSPFVAFITQDAIPANNSWLSSLVEPLKSNQEVQAVFGSHRAHPSHPHYIDEWMISHFRNFERREIQRKSDNLRDYYSETPALRQFLHYYSDNNSCLRKDYWLSNPIPDVFYGEDQLWADWVIQTDKAKAFAADAIVLHSHNYTEGEEFERAKIEAFFFLKYFGYELGQNRLEIEVGIEQEAKKLLNSNDQTITEYRNHLCSLLRSKREGYHAGTKEFFLWLNTTR